MDTTVTVSVSVSAKVTVIVSQFFEAYDCDLASRFDKVY